MRYFILFLTIAFFSFSCKKEKETIVTGTLIAAGGCYADAWSVEIDNPDPAVYSFICKDVPAGATGAWTHNCSNAAYIRLGANFDEATAGQKVRFRFVRNEGILCRSFSFAANNIVIKNLEFLR